MSLFISRVAGNLSKSPARTVSVALGKRLFSNHDEVTHTGQKFSDDDYRVVRFTDKKKLVNKKFAIDLVDEIAPIASHDRVVACDGGGGPLGHPKVYINLDQPGNHTCGYCGLRFYQDHHH